MPSFGQQLTTCTLLNDVLVNLAKNGNEWVVSVNPQTDLIKETIVYSSLGEIVFMSGNDLNIGRIDINAEHLSRGIYFLKVVTQKGETTLKVAY